MKKCFVLISLLMVFFLGEKLVLAENQKLEWDGKITVGLINEAQSIIDRRESEVNTVCGIVGNDKCGPTKTGDNTQVGSGYWGTADLGAHFKQNDAVTAHAVFRLNLDEDAPRAKKFYVDIDIGSGILTFGRASRPYTEMIWSPDIIEFAVGPTAGASYASRGTQISYSTGDMLGDAMIKFGLIQAANPGNKADQKTESPDMELAVSYDNGQFSGGIGVHSGKVNYLDPDDGEIKTMNPTTIAVNAGVSMDMISSSLAFATGDPVFLSGATVKPAISKDLKDKVNSFMLQVTANLGAMSGSVYYGSEVASLSKDNGHTSKTGEVKDVDEQADTIGLRFVHNWKSVDWFAELSTTTQKYDGVTYKDARWAGAGVTVAFGS